MCNKNWVDYYKITHTVSTPRKTLMKAIEIFDVENHFGMVKLAIDLGCGAGTDSIMLLKDDWSVLAIDSQAAAIETLSSSCPQSLQKKLRTKVSEFESLIVLPPSQLINASYSLPFLNRDYFFNFWEIILSALHSGGLFSGIFFGINDSWSTRANMTFLSRDELFSNLLLPFKIEFFAEEEHDESDALGNLKHSHKYFIVAKKR